MSLPHDANRLSEQFLHNATEKAFCIAITDQSGNLIYVNSNFAEITGYSPEELYENDFRLDAECETADFFEEIKQTILRDGNWTGELKNRSRSGVFFYLNIVVATIVENSDPYRYVFYGRHINHSPGQANSSGQHEKLKQQLNETGIQLEIITNDLEEFSHYISHDLRAPVRAVNGFALILKEDYGDKMDSEGHRIIDVIISSVTKMNQLIDDLLDFSRLGRKELKSGPVNMKMLAEDCINLLLTPDQRAGFSITMEEIPDCKGDAEMLRQVWLHLIRNAVKFSSRKEFPSIEISHVSDRELNIYFVRDRGAGFDMEYSHRLFEIFQRLHSVEEFEGKGIGLAFVKRIILRHSGSIWAESAPNKGATFYFSIPKR